MPELPEVETVRRGLETLLIGKQINDVQSDWPKSFPNDPKEVNAFLVGARIESIARRGKVLIIDLNTKYSLLIHLKMTGQLVFRGKTKFGAGHPNASLIGPLPDKSTHVTLMFSDNSHLFFNDQRKFGWVKLVPTIEVPNIDFLKTMGPEPLDSSLTAAQFAERVAHRPKSPIKAVLLDQKVIAGVGNIYADESLWSARIHPATLAEKLTKANLTELFGAIQAIMLLSIKKGGSTDRNYVDAKGNRGRYLSFANVFRRENQPCPRCGTIIQKIRVAGRGTHICPHCQRIKR